MFDPTLSSTPVNSWRKIALRSFFAGAGFALVLVAAVGGVVWRNSRPEPSKPWDLSSLVAKDPPSFSPSGDGKRVEFRYAVENTTDADYQIDSEYEFKVAIRGTKGTLSQPLSSDVLSLPVFLPARQKAVVKISLALSGIPVKAETESDADYHERLRSYLEDRLHNLASFVVFEEVHHYQINLPRWRPDREKSDSGSS